MKRSLDSPHSQKDQPAVADVWKQLDDLLKKNFPQVFQSLNSGASEESISKWEKEAKLKLPAQIRERLETRKKN